MNPSSKMIGRGEAGSARSPRQDQIAKVSEADEDFGFLRNLTLLYGKNRRIWGRFHLDFQRDNPIAVISRGHRSIFSL
jgi:hypothetical protein